MGDAAVIPVSQMGRLRQKVDSGQNWGLSWLLAPPGLAPCVCVRPLPMHVFPAPVERASGPPATTEKLSTGQQHWQGLFWETDVFKSMDFTGWFSGFEVLMHEKCLKPALTQHKLKGYFLLPLSRKGAGAWCGESEGALRPSYRENFVARPDFHPSLGYGPPHSLQQLTEIPPRAAQARRWP